MFLKYSIILTVLCLSKPGHSVFVMEILEMSKIITEGMYKFWEVLEPRFAGPNAPVFLINKEERTLMSKVSEINRKLINIEEKISYVQDTTRNLISKQSEKILMHLKIQPLLQDIDFINTMYTMFMRYLRISLDHTQTRVSYWTPTGENKMERHTLEEFASSIISHGEKSILMKMENINKYIKGSRSLMDMKGIFVQIMETKPDLVYAKSWEDLAYDIIKSAFKSLEIIDDLVYVNDGTEKSIFNSAEQAFGEQLCELPQSTNQLIFNMYTLIQMTQLKAYTMVQFSWMLLRVYNKGNFSMESNLMRQTYLERLQSQARIVKSTMQHAKNDLWKCDPKNHTEGQTYTEITRFLQGFIVNEVDLNSDNTCRQNCAHYQQSSQHTCFQNLFCSKQAPCRGNIVKCTFVDSDMWICLAPRWGNNRRYDWIEYENGRTLGDKKSCQRGVTKVESWWRWLFWHCSYCFCYCDGSSDPLTDRYFNLREVTSDVEKNKVVTGIRFIKEKRVIHIQIQEGELLEYGGINATSISWKPVEAYNVHTKTEGIDYHMLTWKDRAVDLDDLILPKNYLLTGIKFRKIGSHLNLQIRGSEFDIRSGKHFGGKSIWISNPSYFKPRTKVELYKPDIPTKRAIGENVPDSRHDQYIKFTSTDIDADVAQTAVPFIDTQSVAPQPPIALTGAGIYHRGTRHSGGFVAPKVFTYDYSELIMNFLPRN